MESRGKRKKSIPWATDDVRVGNIVRFPVFGAHKLLVGGQDSSGYRTIVELAGVAG